MKKLFFISLAVIGLTLSSCGKDDPKPGPQPIPNDVVDLGLPSGTLWATHNVGASTKTEMGGYYIFGGTKAISTAFKYPDDYPYAKLENDKIVWTKYTTNSESTLEPGDDPATVIMGKGYSTPTLEQVKELCNNTKVETAISGTVKGIRLTSTVTGYTDKSIFVPCSSWWMVGKTGAKYNDTATMQTIGHYMTSELYSKDGEVNGTAVFTWTFDYSKGGAINAGGGGPSREMYAHVCRAVYKK